MSLRIVNDAPSPPAQAPFNPGGRTRTRLSAPAFPNAGAAVRRQTHTRSDQAVDVLLVNPPSPDGGVWIRSQHRVGRRSREEMVWPQCSLAQLAALLAPDHSVAIVDAIAERMSWPQFEAVLRRRSPRLYLTQVTAPTLTNDMYGVMLAKSLGAAAAAFGTHVTPMPEETMRDFPALDFILRGEPELTLRELADALTGRPTPDWARRLFLETDQRWEETSTAPEDAAQLDLGGVAGLVWRRGGEVVLNRDRPFIPVLDHLPMPLHHLLPIDRYRMPMMRGPFSFVLTSRGCPAGCTYCIKHVSYQSTLRLHSPARIVDEVRRLHELGVRNVHMYADLFTVNREQVMGICAALEEAALPVRWTCNSRVDFVDEEMLRAMARAGCWMISWGIESGNEAILRAARKGAPPEKAERALAWARRAGIKNWGYFIIGLPGESVATIRQTIDLAKRLPLELALFHVAAPYPGTPFFFQVVENGWFKEGTRWEEVDMDKETVLQYDGLSSEDLVYWQRRAFREWAFRPGPVLTYLRMLAGDPRTLRRAVRVGLEHLGWALRAG